MAHELTPKAGQQYLLPEEIVRRFRMTFKYVDASESRAVESIQESIQYMRRSGAFSDAEIARLRSIKDRAIDVIVADELAPDLAYLVVLIEPDEKLFFSYESRSHEKAAKPLLERIATVLDYNLDQV
jgi:hypothetical protein